VVEVRREWHHETYENDATAPILCSAFCVVPPLESKFDFAMATTFMSVFMSVYRLILPILACYSPPSGSNDTKSSSVDLVSPSIQAHLHQIRFSCHIQDRFIGNVV
jgi:hypothetical protein